MANELLQTVNQYGIESPDTRMLVQYRDDVTGEEKQVIVNYADLTTDEKTTFDDLKAIAVSKMV